MKVLLLLGALVLANCTYSQDNIAFTELDYGLAKVDKRDAIKAENLPTGNRNISSSLEFVVTTDSIQLVSKATFGIRYMLKAVDSADINVDIEWIFPRKMIDEKGKQYQSIRYTSIKPTNTELGNTYTFDEPYEMIEGRWTLNIYVDKKKLHSRSFVVYR